MRHQIPRVFRPFRPTTYAHNRPRGCFRTGHIPSLDEGPRLDTGCHGIATDTVAVPHDADVAPRPDHVGPVLRLPRVLETGPITCAIAQQDDLGPSGDQSVSLLDQRAMESFGKVSLLALAPLPRQWQGPAFLDHVEHQGDTAAPHDPPIHHQDQCLQGQMPQQHLGIGEKRPCIGALLVLDPPGQACDTALGLVASGYVGGTAGQLRALAAYHTADERREGGHVPGDCACWLARIPLCESVPYGTRPAAVVTPRLLLLDWSHSPEGVYPCGNRLSTHCTMTWQKCPVENIGPHLPTVSDPT